MHNTGPKQTTFLKRVRKIGKSDHELRHACPSEWNNSAPNGRILMKFDVWVFLKHLSEKKNEISWKSQRNNGYVTLITITITFTMISHWILLEWKTFQTNVDTEWTHTFYRQYPLFGKSCHLWDNVEKCGRARQTTDDNIIRRMSSECWINNSSHTHIHAHTHTHIYTQNIFAFPQQQ